MALNSTSKTELRLNMGQWFVGQSDSHHLVAPSLGSCVAVCLYEPRQRIGGMAHVVLPSRKIHLNQTAVLHDNVSRARYGDEAIELLISEIIQLAGHTDLSLTAKLIGGAQMFKGDLKKKNFILIGESNVEVLKKELNKWNVPIVRSDVGGNCGRTVIFDISNGQVLVRRIGEKELTPL
jgi:chemotaxis protein CheD